MKGFIKSLATVSALSSLVVAPMFLSAGQASAQPIGTKANYIGGGATATPTNGGQNEDAAILTGHLTGRLAAPNLPVSARTTVIVGPDTSAIVPEFSVDLPVTNNANVYATAGVSLVEKDGKNSGFGNRDAFVVGLGAEAQVAKNVVIYGNTKLGINAYENSPADALSVNVGAGYAF